MGGAGAKLPEASIPDILGAFRASGLDLQKSMAGAVHWIDEAEEVTGQGVHESERELRMAGGKLAAALENLGEGGSLDVLAVTAHVAESRRIAIMVIASRVSEEAYDLRRRIGQPMLLRNFPDYGKFFAQIHKAAELAKNSAKSENARQELFKWVEEEWSDTKKMYQSLRAMEPALLAAKQDEDDARRKEDRRFRGMLIVAIISVLIGVVGWIF